MLRKSGRFWWLGLRKDWLWNACCWRLLRLWRYSSLLFLFNEWFLCNCLFISKQATLRLLLVSITSHKKTRFLLSRSLLPKRCPYTTSIHTWKQRRLLLLFSRSWWLNVIIGHISCCWLNITKQSLSLFCLFRQCLFWGEI